jgi:hypothetical protein
VSFALTKAAQIRLVLDRRHQGHWRQAGSSSFAAHRGENRRRIAGRWHGQLVTAGPAQLIVQLRTDGRWVSAKRIRLNVRREHHRQ